MKHSKVLSPFKQKGIASVELAIILPLMVFLLISVLEAGMAFSRYNNLTKAVRDGARYMSLNSIQGTGGAICIIQSTSCPHVARAKQLIAYNHISASTDSILPNANTINVTFTIVGANNIATTAKYRHDLISGNLINSFFGTSFPLYFTLTSTVVMRAQ